MRAFEYRHIVSFEETSLVGNVYYVHHLRWQGRCREMFLREHAPGVIEQLREGLQLVTLRCSCDYLGELWAGDEVHVRMRLGAQVQHRLTLLFEYVKTGAGGDERVAEGVQEIACMMQDGSELRPCEVPEELRQALRPFGGK